MGTFANSNRSSTPASGFEVRIVVTEADLAEAGQVREEAYGHHLGSSVSNFSMSADPLDTAPGTAVFLCRDKASGQAIGTARIQSAGQGAGADLLIERSVALPQQLTSQSRAEVTRLAVLPGASPLVKLSLMKAVYQYCQAHDIRWLVIAARNEALSRGYRHLGFQDFLPRGQTVPLAHAGMLPHAVFTLDVQGIGGTWRRMGHRLSQFMFETMHDLPVFPKAQASPPLAS